MPGCLKFVGFFILGFIYLIFLASKPGVAIVLGILTFVGYIFWSNQQKLKAVKEAEEKRKQAIALARQREGLYEYDSSIQPWHKRSTNNIFESPKKWAESIEERYELARKHILDAELVLNDDIELLSQYRHQLRTELIPKYEAAIKTFFNELSLRDKDIPIPKELKVAIDFVYPSDLQPKAINEDLIRSSQRFSQDILNAVQGRNITKLQKGEVISLAIITAIHGISHLVAESQQRAKLEKVQADVDLICEQISGAIKTYGRAAEEIKHLKSVHEVAANYVIRYLDTVIQLSTNGKLFSELQEPEQKSVEACYRGGQSLKQIMKQDVIQPISSTS